MTTHILDLEQFAFDLLNQLADEYSVYDDGSFAKAIQETTDPEKMEGIISQLQTALLEVMRASIPLPPIERPEFPFGEFDNGNHWQGIF